ncbi:iron ABC transporter permease [Mesohalobacter halotolerans]|uniref:Iron ABC transporter permease n=1 Tax=Mesohalobacter halotolerans TaxID=1883405 RepID=A0A4U5TQY9_9FLAO|nr:iron ABC transporter permease [Mesohalobacter halotolerans]TKS56483.1 iron ABC transporter permease [Mesohalobacter halotolerans]
MKTLKLSLISILILILVLLLNISLGSVSIPLQDITRVIFTGESSVDTWTYIILDYRLPKAMTAIIVGSGLGVSGLLMQTFFRNPLAGPYVLGLSSGASLGVALLLMGSGILGLSFTNYLWFSKTAVILASSLGSLMVMGAVLITSVKIKDSMALLIIGLMFASLTGAVVNLLSYFSASDELQQFVFWSLGSLGDLSWSEVSILGVFWFLGLILCLFLIKPLDALLIGESYAKSLGVHIKLLRFMTIIATCVLTGSITAFAGPIAFVGLAIPHLMRLILKTNKHLILLPTVCMGGAVVMLICDSISQLPGVDYTLPINAVTSLFGAPIVIWLILRSRQLNF